MSDERAGGDGSGADDDDDVPPPLRLVASSVEVPQDVYPTEVMCRKCRNLMLPADPEGRGWECWVCSRRIDIVLKGAARS